MFQRPSQWMQKVTRTFHRELWPTGHKPDVSGTFCPVLLHYIAGVQGVTGASSRQERRHWLWPHFFSWEMNWSAFLAKWWADGVRPVLLAWILGEGCGPQRMPPISVVPSPHHTQMPSFVITAIFGGWWWSSSKVGWRETYCPGDSRKTSGMPNLEKASEQAGSGSPGSFICSWDSWAGKWVQLMDLKAHSNENYYHNDVVN